jgi:hypothetical protein
VEEEEEEDEEFYDSEPLPILGRCKALYPFEGEGKNISGLNWKIANLTRNYVFNHLYMFQLRVKAASEWKRTRTCG